MRMSRRIGSQQAAFQPAMVAQQVSRRSAVVPRAAAAAEPAAKGTQSDKKVRSRNAAT
jgi:hypothetical protein